MTLRFVAHVVICLLLGCVTPRGGAEERMLMDVNGFLEGDHPAIRITGISVRTLFRTNLNRERFERYLETTGPDYVLHISNPGLAREIGELLVSIDFEASDRVSDGDFRYKLVLMDGKQTTDVFYIGVFGEVLHGERLLLPKRKKGWLPKAWKLLEHAMFR